MERGAVLLAIPAPQRLRLLQRKTQAAGHEVVDPVIQVLEQAALGRIEGIIQIE
jgi:predicted NAD/FAD-dependent oxidoreductase